jgi:hypothetical protein
MDEGERGEENKIKTDKCETFRTRWFFGVFFVVIFLSIGATYYRIFIARDYAVMLETVCDPISSACFARDICETEDGICGEGDIPVETTYYKVVERKAYAFPNECAFGSLDAPECADLSCRVGDMDCTETFCTDEVVLEGETCVGPGFVPEEPAVQEEGEIEGEGVGNDEGTDQETEDESEGDSESI